MTILKTAPDKNIEIVRAYHHRYIRGVGEPIGFVSCWQTESELYCECVVFIAHKEKPETYADSFKTDKRQWVEFAKFSGEDTSKVLELFADTQAESAAAACVFSAIEKAMELNLDILPRFDEFVQWEPVNGVMYLKRKLPKDFRWFLENTQSNFLKAILKIASGITHTRIS